MLTSLQTRRWKTPATAAFALSTGLALCALWPDAALAQTAHTPVLLDPNFHTPAPPNAAFPQNPAHVLYGTAGMLAVALIAVAVALAEGARTKSTVPLALVMGAAFCVFPESIDNYLGGCYWSQSHNPNQIFYFLMGREFDNYIIVMWWAFGAVLGYVIYAVLLRNLTTRALWTAFAIAGAADIVIEETLLGYGGIYTYFGHQPLVLINHFPCWWLFVNVSALFFSVALAYRFRDWFNGWKSVFILALMPLCYIGGFTFAGLPAIYVIQGDFSPLITQLGGVLSVVIALVQAGGIMFLVLGRNPLALNEKPQAELNGALKRLAPMGSAIPQA